MTGEPAGKRGRGRPKGSYKKPQFRSVFEEMDPRDKAFLQEAWGICPAGEHKAVDRVCAEIKKETGIIVEGNPKLLLWALYRTSMSWILYDYGLGGHFGYPSRRIPHMGTGKRRSLVFQYLRASFEEASGVRAPFLYRKDGDPFFRFLRIAILGLAPPEFLPELDKAEGDHLFRKAIENAFTPIKKLYALAPRVTMTVKFPDTN
ncbi:MAG: hypothetical protein ACREDV_11690 [Methylocella sp.]